MIVTHFSRIVDPLRVLSNIDGPGGGPGPFRWARRVAMAVLSVFVVPVGTASAEELKVMKQGLGSGTISSSPAGIACGATCNFDFPAVDVTLSASFNPADTTFTGWQGDGISCPGTGSCVVNMSSAHAVRAVFTPASAIPVLNACAPPALPPNDCTAQSISDFLAANGSIDTIAEFIAALPPLFRENWILMGRSESLQTGVALYPRVLMPSHDARFVFSFGLKAHDSFPGSHPQVVEYMQWDATRKNFRFHEVVLARVGERIPNMHLVDGAYTFPERSRGVIKDNPKCTKCHSTHNVPNTSAAHGTSPEAQPGRTRSRRTNRTGMHMIAGPA